MIEFTKGDMFEVQVDARVNTVNCVGVMGAGVALAFKVRYPEMFKEYQKACRDGRVQPGTLHVWKSVTGEWVINFPTKRDWRDPSRYEDILSGLDALRAYLHEQGQISVALPALGCGHGGLDWEKVAPMISEKLGDLDARILVFEPADSRKIGRAAHEQPTDEQLHALEILGFKLVALSQYQDGPTAPATILAKGDPTLLSRHWVALLPSKELTEREESALEAVARRIALSTEPTTVAVVHATRRTERVVELFLNHGVAVVLIMPFGPLARKPIARIPTDNRPARFAMVSVAGPNAPWSRPILAEAMNLLKALASCVLLTDPAPAWLSDQTMHSWAERPVFYLRYDNLPEEARRILDHEGARAIGRRPDTGEPNLQLLLSASAQELRITPSER
jgi:O-acetyl-ADP-ribose deacetylase (regulator of RNase III)